MMVTFDDWWGSPVIKDFDGGFSLERNLFLPSRILRGGAHVDPAVNNAHRALAESNSLGWVIGD